jgi:hypothetical protein
MVHRIHGRYRFGARRPRCPGAPWVSRPICGQPLEVKRQADAKGARSPGTRPNFPRCSPPSLTPNRTDLLRQSPSSPAEPERPVAPLLSTSHNIIQRHLLPRALSLPLSPPQHRALTTTTPPHLPLIYTASIATYAVASVSRRLCLHVDGSSLASALSFAVRSCERVPCCSLGVDLLFLCTPSTLFTVIAF